MYNIPKFYDDLCLSLENSWSACGWDSQETQYSHFILLSSIIRKNSTVLDVGCGQGDFYNYLKSLKLNTHYCGIDFSELMIKKAKDKYPDAEFLRMDFLSSDLNFDFVVASGTFNFQVENQYDYIRKSIQKCYETCNKACAIALTSDLAKIKYEEPVFYYCPKKIFEISLEFAPKVILNTASFEDEFVLFMYKDLL